MGEAGVKAEAGVLVVEDDPGLARQLKWSLADYQPAFAENRSEAIAALRRHEPAVVLLDLGLPPDAEGVAEGFATLHELLALAPRTKVIVVTGNADRDNALKAVRFGAFDFYQKPVDLEVLKLIVDRAARMAALERENQRLAMLPERSPIAGIIAADASMLKLCRTIEKVAPTDISVLLLGESGTGKELLARALHDLSERRKHRFVAINCAAIPENLLESELFGHERGAFTGAHKQTIGKVEVAGGGTLFLDEIGDMPIALQGKLLRFLQSRVIERIGGRQEIPVDVRVVCATNRNPKEMIAEQRFREDLFYRISEVTLEVPPLRQRGGDVVVLAQALLNRYAQEFGRPVRGFAPDALSAIEHHPWPGNVREMENRIKSAVIMSEGRLLTAADLSLAPAPGEGAFFTLREVRAEAERRAIVHALAVSDGNVSAAAARLGISRPTLYDLMERLGVGAAK
ncbi:MAG TPA: PEP-CTERM-box response regulator transcription factor [Steroidobacteraceae bacterium]|nr:PEP-CTERM-box response regulator transcription factor [Steroidobacteraceae bacterium]